MPLKQLQIAVEDSDTVLTIDYTPEEYTLNNENTFAVQNIPGLGSPIVQFVNGAQRTLEVELFFDKQHPSRLFFRTPGGVLLACSETAGKEETVVKLRPTTGKARLAGAYEPSPPDPPARPV